MSVEKYNKEIKITLLGFAFGFFFSFILGLIVGNPIFITITRAFIGSLLFAFIIFGIMYIVKRYVPEIINIAEDIKKPKDEKSINQDDNEAGPKINYMVGVEKDDPSGSRTKEDGSLNNKDKENMKTFPMKKDTEKSGMILNNKTSEGVVENEDELPPIEELLGEEEDISPETEIGEGTISQSKKKGSNDYISVGDVKIPNEPEIIAKAIKKVMNKNE